ncbi:DUF4279 domain-containing protein [Vitreimonas flagellata]|uniref:DUF4279 domain-containing protein n=1 Tax=Vitreimonas flagellata TaxID=2560861 RepID=UPI001074B4B8
MGGRRWSRSDRISPSRWRGDTLPAMTLSLTFSIWSEQYAPDEITERLRAPPDGTAIRGLDQAPVRYAPPKHGWRLITETEADLPAEDLLSQLLARTQALGDALVELRTRDSELEVRITLYFDRACPDASLELSPTIIANLARLKALLFIDRVDLSTGHH